MNTNTTTENLVEFPAAPVGRPSARQWRAVRREREAYRLAEKRGPVTVASMDEARKALRRVIRAGNLSARVCEMENDPAYFRPDGSEGVALVNLREREKRATAAASVSVGRFGARLTWPGIYPIVESDGPRGLHILLEW